MVFSNEQMMDLVYLFNNRYKRDYESIQSVWGVDDEILDTLESIGFEGLDVPSLGELTNDALCQLKRSIVQCPDPARIAKTLDVLSRMQEKVEKAKEIEEIENQETLDTITNKIEQLLIEDNSEEAIQEVDLSLVAPPPPSRKAKKRKVIPSKEVNGLDEGSETP